MKLFYCYTPSHLLLVENYFLPSVSDKFELNACIVPIQGTGDFLSQDFLQCIRHKVDLIIESIKNNSGQAIVWSDTDIYFLNTSPEQLLEALAGNDIVFQREKISTSEVNTGFFVCKCCPATERFFYAIRQQLDKTPNINEQRAVNVFLIENPDVIVWSHLPLSYYARSQGWPPPANMLLYHANMTAGPDGIQQKIEQFKDLELLKYFRPLALIFVTARKAIRYFYRYSRSKR